MTETPANPTIMLVDDTPENLQLLREMFDRAEYRVVAFPSGKLALAAAAESKTWLSKGAGNTSMSIQKRWS